MKQAHRLIPTTIVMAIICGCGPCGREDGGFVFPDLEGPYLGQSPPGMEAVLFAPGAISTGMSERDVAMTPDGKELYYSMWTGSDAVIMVTRLGTSGWSEPEVAGFSGTPDYFSFEPALNPDGNSLFFLSTRPRSGKEPKPGWTHQNIWAVDRRPDGGWSEPYDIGPPVNSDDNEFYPSLTRNGRLYFTRTAAGSLVGMLFRADRIGDRYSEPVRIPVADGEGQSIYNVFADPDERFIIGCVKGMPDDPEPDNPAYYVFFRDSGDLWSDGINMGPQVNFPGTDASSASLSYDGRYLFFAAAVPATTPEEATLGELIDRRNQPRNGQIDIYWIDAGIIEQLRNAAGLADEN